MHSQMQQKLQPACQGGHKHNTLATWLSAGGRGPECVFTALSPALLSLQGSITMPASSTTRHGPLMYITYGHDPMMFPVSLAKHHARKRACKTATATKQRQPASQLASTGTRCRRSTGSLQSVVAALDLLQQPQQVQEEVDDVLQQHSQQSAQTAHAAVSKERIACNCAGSAV